ncbi:glycosyl hydrolase [Olivibacter sp. SDN3]|nr:glycosyl hydrolase [Olivibacter sp. SDN3]
MHTFSVQKKRFYLAFFSLLLSTLHLFAQESYELNNNWKCLNYKLVKDVGENLSVINHPIHNWKPAVVPGTILTTMLENGEIPDPFFGMNNEKIPDIYAIGKDHYTYWFVNDFDEKVVSGDQQVWLNFRGINYSCEIFLNGNKVNPTTVKGMYLRQSFNITDYLSKDGKNRLAVLVFPPDVVGNPNGGQGGDGTIAKNVGLQYTAGWDWIQPIRDRNTGIWDKVFIEKTGPIAIKDPHIVTLLPGKRKTSGDQAPATIKVSTTLQNATSRSVSGTLQFSVAGEKISKEVTIGPKGTIDVAFPDHILKNPKLWWPANYGDQHLYTSSLEFLTNKEISDQQQIAFGVREIQTYWNPTTRSKEIAVNGQKIFIKGGNWIVSDAMLRFSKERYDAEIRFHRDMNLNLIRVWGGALTERPEFYEACDRYGLLVIQDFWMSGDCNGRWEDPKKLDDQWTRRQYPDDHSLFLASAADMIKMIRNHPSLAIWCGGNEITPPDDILVALKDSIMPQLDGTRWFIDYSNSDEMSYNFIGGNGDGPYGIQDIETFWADRTWPFNSEVGSVGIGDMESLERFLPKKNLVAPIYTHDETLGTSSEEVDSVWKYHTYIGYGKHIAPYGTVTDVEDFAKKAQLVNYNQYRGLIEGFSSHMWEWYTGTIIWKTQNPWTSMRGQLYDYYLDPNAGLYGLRKGSEPLHVMYDPVDGFIMVANNLLESKNNVMLSVKAYDMEGEVHPLNQVFIYMEPSSVKKILPLKQQLQKIGLQEGLFLNVQLLSANKELLSDNFYWLPNEDGQYSGLQQLKKVPLDVQVQTKMPGEYEVTLHNSPENPVAFFNRISLVDQGQKQRILPTFYDDNYVSIPPGGSKTIKISCPKEKIDSAMSVAVEGWNVDTIYIPIS